MSGAAGAGASFGTFEHQADVGIYGRGPSLEIAFAQVGLALCDEVVPIREVRSHHRELAIEAEGFDLESLLLDYLNQLNTGMRIARLAVGSVEVDLLDPSSFELRARARGEDLDFDRHPTGAEVKAVTACCLQVQRLPAGGYDARCVIDV